MFFTAKKEYLCGGFFIFSLPLGEGGEIPMAFLETKNRTKK